jgi:hypothetical protein
MTWNWQQPDWPNFSFDPLKLMPVELGVLHKTGELRYARYCINLPVCIRE